MKLTDRQKDIINLMRQGLTKEEIAGKYAVTDFGFLNIMQKIYPQFANVIDFKKVGKFEQLQKYLRSENITPPPAQTIKPPERINPETGEERLTERENEVYKLLLAGKSYKEIAEELHIADTTVKTHVTAIFGKKLVNSAKELIIKGYKSADKPEVKPVQSPAVPVPKPTPEPPKITNVIPISTHEPEILKRIKAELTEIDNIITKATIQKEILEKILKE